jgi:vacuolar-type H+-ATPase subunit I/STV1
MDKSYENIQVNRSLLDEVWSFDPRELDNKSGVDLSRYAVCLSQYLVYYTFNKNKTKAEIHRLNKYIERSVSMRLADDKELSKRFKTKADAINFLITSDTDLMEKQARLDALNLELIEIEGMDKSISELVATIKRELTRRENELYSMRRERR